MSVTSGSARDVALIRQLRFSGLMRWKLHEIIGALPLILHASLAVFSAGLVVFIQSLYPALSWIVIGISGVAFAFYLGSIILPVIDISCPYRIALLYKPSKYIVNMFEAIYRALIAVNRSTCRQMGIESDSSTDLVDEEIKEAVYQTWSLSDAEKSQVTEFSEKSMMPLAYDCIFWLHNMSSNTTVRRIAAWSFAGDFFQNLLYLSSYWKLKALKKFSIPEMFSSFFTGEDILSEMVAYRASSNLHMLTETENFKLPSQYELTRQFSHAACKF